MWTMKRSAMLSFAVCVAVSVILAVLLFTAPQLFEWYMTTVRGIAAESAVLSRMSTVFVWCFYPGAVFAAGMLAALLKLLLNIRNGAVFVRTNVICLKAVSWGCFAIAAITAVGACFYMPFLFVAAAGAFTGVLLRVLKNVMQAAVELREENDLTV